jgi:hypothetical protein
VPAARGVWLDWSFDGWTSNSSTQLFVVRFEAEEWHVVEVGFAHAVNLWRGDFDDEHFGEKLDCGAEQVAGVAGGAVFLEADRDVELSFRQDEAYRRWLHLVVVSAPRRVARPGFGLSAVQI